MILVEYFNKVKDEIKKHNYKIININQIIIPSKISLHMEAINYMIFEWNEDHMDSRNDIFDYIIRPNNCDFDFTSITFEEFFYFLMSSKDDNIELLDIEDKNDDIVPTDELDEFWLR